MSKVALLDANVLISLTQWLPPDKCDGFWQWLVTAPDIRTVGKVRQECQSDNRFFKSLLCIEDVGRYGDVAIHVSGNEKLDPESRDDFLNGGDFELVATAAADSQNRVIVTAEKLVPANSKKCKIPNVAQHFGVRCLSPRDWLKVAMPIFNMSVAKAASTCAP